jgi:hypothetical protein
VDLDYKALSNAGTWFLGRLQTERDKERVLDGLEGAVVSGQKQFNRRNYDVMLSGLGNRIFLINNVHEDAPVVFETRWAMSYLRGPLTREQIKLLIEPIKKQRITAASQSPLPSELSSISPVSPTDLSRTVGKPIVAPDIREYFIPCEQKIQES